MNLLILTILLIHLKPPYCPDNYALLYIKPGTELYKTVMSILVSHFQKSFLAASDKAFITNFD